MLLGLLLYSNIPLFSRLPWKAPLSSGRFGSSSDSEIGCRSGLSEFVLQGSVALALAPDERKLWRFWNRLRTRSASCRSRVVHSISFGLETFRQLTQTSIVSWPGAFHQICAYRPLRCCFGLDIVFLPFSHIKVWPVAYFHNWSTPSLRLYYSTSAQVAAFEAAKPTEWHLAPAISKSGPATKLPSWLQVPQLSWIQCFIWFAVWDTGLMSHFRGLQFCHHQLRAWNSIGWKVARDFHRYLRPILSKFDFLGSCKAF